jgi:steroid 5-alpha reductase family enzyme
MLVVLCLVISRNWEILVVALRFILYILGGGDVVVNLIFVCLCCSWSVCAGARRPSLDHTWRGQSHIVLS